MLFRHLPLFPHVISTQHWMDSSSSSANAVRQGETKYISNASTYHRSCLCRPKTSALIRARILRKQRVQTLYISPSFGIFLSKASNVLFHSRVYISNENSNRKRCAYRLNGAGFIYLAESPNSQQWQVENEELHGAAVGAAKESNMMKESIVKIRSVIYRSQMYQANDGKSLQL